MYITCILNTRFKEASGYLVQTKQIDEKNKVVGFYQEVLDRMPNQGFANAIFEMDLEDEELFEDRSESDVMQNFDNQREAIKNLKSAIC